MILCYENGLLLREKYCIVRAVCIVRSLAGCKDQPCSWVHREGRGTEEKREDLLAKSVEKNCMLHLNIL